MNAGLSLLESVQGLLQRTYRLRAELDVGRFVIGDLGYRNLYGSAQRGHGPASSSGDGARTLIRETDDGLRACVYFPDDLIRTLEADPPQHGVSERNVDPFGTLIEELDHLLCVADGAARKQPLSLFELELHANVSKYLVLARFAAGREERLPAGKKVWLRFHVFGKHRFSDEDPEVRARYRDAARWAVRFLELLEAIDTEGRVELLRRFHRGTATGKLRLISELAA